MLRMFGWPLFSFSSMWASPVLLRLSSPTVLWFSSLLSRSWLLLCWFFGRNLFFFFQLYFWPFTMMCLDFFFIIHWICLSLLNLYVNIILENSQPYILQMLSLSYCILFPLVGLQLNMHLTFLLCFLSHILLGILFIFFLYDHFCIATLTTVALMSALCLPALLLVYMPFKRQVSCQSLLCSLPACLVRVSVFDRIKKVVLI